MRAVRIRPPAPGKGQPGAVRVDLALPRLALTGWNARARAQQRFQATALVLDRPNLKFTPPAQPPPVWKLVSKFLRRTDLAQLRVNHAEFEISGLRHLPQVRDLNLTGRAIRIDSLAALTPGRIAYARPWQANSGRITAPFDLQANRQGTTGTMRAEYSGLRLELLGYKDEEIKQPPLKRVISKAANVAVIRDQNPRKRGELVTGEMTSTREPRFSVFALWRQGIVSGLFHSIGIPQKIAQKLSESKDEAPLPK